MSLTVSQVKVIKHLAIVLSGLIQAVSSCSFLSFFSNFGCVIIRYNVRLMKNTRESLRHIVASLCVGVGLSGFGRHGIFNCWSSRRFPLQEHLQKHQ
jgi:hypothetical protein